ncbi:fibrinogen-binding protein [Rhodopirellula europaea]|uniref:Fibrinogen-binding protein n=1 Tax=Rhodopirellula europaea SH398 TaxID=1263868 RepID=M5SHQ8_9BACT|nr:fibrinogen-binding protein [Rhodopirellula europaea]EMI25729.1 fibrinogen-binding protein [Rhodopirellula europaea SH398]
MAKTCRVLTTERLEGRHLMASVSLDAMGPAVSGPVLAQEAVLQASVASIQVEDAPNLRAAEIRFEFDPKSVRIDKEDIRPGAIWDNKAALIANVDEQTGTVVAYVFSTQPILGSDGNLLDIEIDQSRNAACLTPAKLDLQHVRLNEGTIELESEPVEGPDPTDHSVMRSSRSTDMFAPPETKPFIGPVLPDHLKPNHVDTVMNDLFRSPVRGRMLGFQRNG